MNALRRGNHYLTPGARMYFPGKFLVKFELILLQPDITET